MKTTRDKINFTGEQILAIAASAPEKLFSGDSAIAKSEYYEFSRRWHPDHNKNAEATAVFQRVTELYRTALELIGANAWRGAGVLELSGASVAATFAERRIPYFKIVNFELGDIYIGETNVVFSVERKYADLFENAKRQITGFRFANARMQKEIERNLPGEPEFFATTERLIMLLPKTPDLILLEDLLEYLGGAIDARHVAWIENRLHNLACYFEYAGIAHHDISPRTVWVSPEFHTATLLGGWWYARVAGEKINALPARTINLAPPDVIRNKRADGRVDLELIRQTGREMLGDASGARLKTDAKIPAAMRRWFSGATSGSAVTDYELWKNVLEMDFGAPRFVRLDVEPAQIYGA